MCKTENEDVVHPARLHNIETAIAYVALCTTSVFIVEK